MKILCQCGAKYAVDVTPEMAQRPVQFICPACGMDSSGAVNQLIQQELAAAAPVAAAQAGLADSPSTAAAAIPAAQAHSSAAATAVATGAEVCFRHAGDAIAHYCMVCNKPMCRKCMELFGYVCSPFCRARAESRKMKIPVYAGQRAVSEARLWRKVGLVVAGLAVMCGLLIGAWVWYEWFGSRPKAFFTITFPEGVRGGESHFCGKDQLLFRSGVSLTRYDLAAKREVWSKDLVSKQRIDELIDQGKRKAQQLIAEAQREGWDRIPSMPSAQDLREGAVARAAYSLDMFVEGSNVWITAEPGKLVRLDWASGSPAQDLEIPRRHGAMAREGNELTIRSVNGLRQRVVTRVDLTSGKLRSETFGEPYQPPVAEASGRTATARRTARPSQGSAGLPLKPGASREPLDPAKVAAEAQRLPLAGKIALPAMVANTLNQERILAELEEQDGEADVRRALGTAVTPKDSISLVSSKHGSYGFAVRVLEERFVERTAMKEPPKKSALDGNVSVTQTTEIANELLNEIQRTRGGDKVVEDESRYLVTMHAMDAKAPDWSGEVVGPPRLISLKSVTVIAAGSSVTVLDKSNRKLWQAALSQRLPKFSAFFDDGSRFGQLPCAELKDRLYVCDQGMLTAFDLKTGNVFWRLPSVGIRGLMFDDTGMLYVNTTTASPDTIKYSRQIDVSSRVADVILKVDPASGKTLWSTEPGGPVSYLSGKFIYVASWNDADDLAESGMGTGFETPSYVRIKRLDPDSGEIMWDYYQPRAALDVQFNQNLIQIVYKKEMQMLKYLTF